VLLPAAPVSALAGVAGQCVGKRVARSVPRKTSVADVFDLRQKTNFPTMGRADLRRIVYVVGQRGRKRQ